MRISLVAFVRFVAFFTALFATACGDPNPGPSGPDSGVAIDAHPPIDGLPMLACPTAGQAAVFTAQMSGKTMFCSLSGGPEWPCQFEPASVFRDENAATNWCIFRCRREQNQESAPGHCEASTVVSRPEGGIACKTIYDTPMVCR